MRVVFKPFDWKTWEDDPETPDPKLHIEAYGHNRESESVLVRIDDFHPYTYFELPDRGWTQADIFAIHEFFKRRMRENAPLKCVLTHRKRLYYYRANKVYPLLMMTFPNEGALRHALNIIKKGPIEPLGMGKLTLVPRESDVPSLKKLLAVRRITYVGWISAEAERIPLDDERSISAEVGGFKHEYLVSWRTLTAVPDHECSLWSVTPKMLSWDLEVLSAGGPRVFPKAVNVGDEIMMVGVTTQQYGQPHTRKRILLVYGPHEDLPDAEVRRFDSEIAMLHGFVALIIEEDPDILLGYNILGFDYPYAIRRMLNVYEEWRSCGRIRDRKPTAKSLSWASSAYGHQELTYLTLDGRISIDLLPIIKRDYKLDQYTLDFVGHYFIKKTKAPIEPKEIVRYCKIAHGYCFEQIAAIAQSENPHELDDPDGYRLHTSEARVEVLAAYQTHRGTSAVVEAVLSVYRKYQAAVMTEIGKYCVIDTILPIELFEKLNYWINLSELAQIVKVTIMDTFTRGQQVRVFSQFYDEICAHGFYIDYRPPSNLPFTGGYVHHPIPGLYQDVISYDFASLYPSLIIAYNICYTTFVPDGVDIPDEDCHVIEWEDDGTEEAAVFDDDGQVKVVEEGTGPRTVKRKFRYRFVKKHIRQGIYPAFITALIARRKATKNLMEAEEEGSFNYNILDARQLGLKVSCNSCYGFLGVRNGAKLPLLEAGICVTAMGRFNIHEIMTKVVEVYGGQQVYGDTDSCMVRFPHIPRTEIHAFGKQSARELSATLPPPMKLEYEKTHAEFFTLTAKRYATVKLREDGTAETDPDKLYKRGIVLSRRDNCKYLRALYKEVLLCILYRKGFEAAVEIIYDYFIRLMSHAVPLEQLIIIKSLNSAYKSETNNMCLFGKRLNAMGKAVQAGDRLEFVYVHSAETLQGYKMMLPSMVREDPETYRVDFPYYIEKQLTNPIQQLLEIGFHVRKHYIRDIYRRLLAKQALMTQIRGMRQKTTARIIRF